MRQGSARNSQSQQGRVPVDTSLPTAYIFSVTIRRWSSPQPSAKRTDDSWPLAGDRDLRRMPNPAPGGVQGGVLAEAGLVTEEQRRLAFSGFFLAWDRCIAAIGVSGHQDEAHVPECCESFPHGKLQSHSGQTTYHEKNYRYIENDLDNFGHAPFPCARSTSLL